MSNEDGHDNIDLTLRLGFNEKAEDDKEKVEDNTAILELNNQLELANSNVFVQGNVATMRQSTVYRICKVCGVDQTPLWRKGPDGPQTLCNACGLRYARILKKNG